MKAAAGVVSDWYFGLRAARSRVIAFGQDADMMTPADVLEESFIANARRNAELADYMTMIQLATVGSMGKEGQQEFGKALKQLRGKD